MEKLGAVIGIFSIIAVGIYLVAITMATYDYQQQQIQCQTNQSCHTTPSK